MTKADKKLLKIAMKKYIEDAELDRESAAYSGSWSDGGCAEKLRELNAYKEGLRGIIPNFLFSYYVEASKKADPEYAQYRKLKHKFEN